MNSWSRPTPRGLGPRIIVAVLQFSSVFSAPWSLGCGSGAPSGPRPKPAIGESSFAQVRFRELSSKWHAATPAQRNQLEQPFRQFLEEYPNDNLARLAQVYLAWILIQKGQLVEARERIEEARRGPTGVTRDFATVTEAALLVQYNRAQEALKLLRPLQGKIIDPVERFMSTEQLVIASMGANLYSEAILYMVDWSTQAPVTQREEVREAIVSRLHQVPQRYLERALVQLEPSEEETAQETQRDEERRWLHGAIGRRLSAIARETEDSELAHLVLEHSSELGTNPEEADELVRLSAGDDVVSRIQGRTVGLVLSTETPLRQRRSTEAALGLSTALGLPARAGQAGAVRLVFGEDKEQFGGMSAAIAELAARGAGLIIAGVDAETAEAAAVYAERAQIPALLLFPHPLRRPSFSFVLGVSEERQREVLTQQVRGAGFSDPAIVPAGASECETTESFVPVAKQWQEQSVGAVLLFGDVRCSRKFLQQAASVKYHPFLVFGLEAAPLGLAKTSANTLTLGVGAFPLVPGHPLIRDWYERIGRMPTWFEALGRDAAKIAEAALLESPAEGLQDPKAVDAYREQVRLQLRALPSIELWSAQQASFTAQLRLPRQYYFVREEP